MLATPLMRATPSGAIRPRRVEPLSANSPMVVRHYGAMYFAIVFTEADRRRAIEAAEQDAVAVFRGAGRAA